MRTRVDRTITILLAAGVVVAGLELTSYAANGRAFVLGGSNSESRPASLTNTGKGAALSLHVSKAAPPLTVSNGNKVAHLNADTVDGLHAQALTTRVITYQVPGGTPVAFNLKLDSLPAGKYLASFDVFMQTTIGAGPAICTLGADVGPAQLLSYGAVNGGGYTSSAAGGLVTRARQHPLFLACNNASTVVAANSGTSQVTLTPVAGVTTKSLVPAFRTPRLSRAGR